MFLKSVYKIGEYLHTRDAVLVSVAGEGTSVFGGFVIFAVLGYMAHMSGTPVDQVVSSGA